MSTLPGQDAWRDAGLDTSEDQPVNLVEEKSATESGNRPDEYQPTTPRPDLDGKANEADVVEQASVVIVEDEDYA